MHKEIENQTEYMDTHHKIEKKSIFKIIYANYSFWHEWKRASFSLLILSQKWGREKKWSFFFKKIQSKKIREKGEIKNKNHSEGPEGSKNFPEKNLSGFQA